jgi:D-arabinose 1-dehydrogenase-like Zn-dependent alcohol dehydrogenase
LERIRGASDVLHDPDLAEAILDRVLERGRHIELHERSYRTRHPPLDLSPPQGHHQRDLPEFPEITGQNFWNPQRCAKEESMPKMRVAQVPKPGADFELVEREVSPPGPGHVRIRVLACGVCHSDSYTKEGLYPGITYPRVPGHEVAGEIDELGPGVSLWRKGQRVGVGWHGGQDGTCLACRRGDFANCPNAKITGISFDGGYAEYMIAPAEAVAAMPESLDPAAAAPLLCAGITTFNALRHSGALPSDLVAVQGIGGLGHLGIQFAQKFGYKVAAVGRGPQNAAVAKELGAHVYIDSVATNAAAELQRLGGARVILATAPSSKAMSALIDGLGANGRMVVVGATPDPIEATPVQLIRGKKNIQGWYAGIAADSEDTLRFAELTGVRPMIEQYPLVKAADAYARMMSGQAQFRVVLTM